VVDIKAAEKVLQEIADDREYGINSDKEVTLSKLQKIEKGLKEFALSEEDKTHSLYLKNIEQSQESLQRQISEQQIVYCQQTQTQILQKENRSAYLGQVKK